MDETLRLPAPAVRGNYLDESTGCVRSVRSIGPAAPSGEGYFLASTVSIVDVGIGNINSIHNGLLAVGVSPTRAKTASDVANADKLILPGVGHFRAAKERLKALDLYEALEAAVTEHKKPILGICLGLQLMCARSEEGNESGFGWIDAEVIKLRATPGSILKVPHICWNGLDVVREAPLLDEVSSGSECYFAHSYHVEGVPTQQVLATTDYGHVFPSVVQHGHVQGTQFHPEKSGPAGLALLRNFATQ